MDPIGPSRAAVKVTALACLLPLVIACADRASTPQSLAVSVLAQIAGDIDVQGLDSIVEVRRDRWGVPHIYARTQGDLFFAQGFVAAQDRLFQMEMWRRGGEGRLAEVLGPDFVERDRLARLLRFRGDMAEEWTSYAEDTREIATAFASGVNAYIDRVSRRLPVEFTLLGFAPQPWTPEVTLQRMAALSMTGNAAYEAERAQLVHEVGAERAGLLWPSIPRRRLDPAPGLSFAGITPRALGAYGDAAGAIRYPRVEGSNNWAVSGALTLSGKPLMANDPHRYLDSPSLRYITHLVGPGWNVIGAGEPGLPGVATGHNERIGFGFTIIGMDQQDVYVETLGPCGTPPLRCYRHGGAWLPVKRVVDTIAVKGDAPREVRLEFTAHGPILSEEAAGPTGESRAFALRFVGSEPGTAGYLAQLSVNRASNWESFVAAAARWKLPSEYLGYADVDGNIGWIAAGLLPKRHWSGLLPVPGTGGYEWGGFLPAAQLPREYNPPAGFIVTANDAIRVPGYAHPLSHEFDVSARGRRIAQALRSGVAGTRLGVSDFERLQGDEYSAQAHSLIPFLAAAAARADRSQRWEFRVMADWDYVMRADRTGPLLFAFWKRALATLMLERLVASETARAILGDSWLDNWDEFDGPLRLVGATTRDSLLLMAMDTAVARLHVRLGGDTSKWSWGAVHTAAFPHRISGAFDLQAVPRGGDVNTVNSTYGADHKQWYGASFRAILDLADWDRSVATSTPGQSGQPGSEFYGNLLPLWARGEYFPLLYSRAAVERETRHILWLRPQPADRSR